MTNFIKFINKNIYCMLALLFCISIPQYLILQASSAYVTTMIYNIFHIYTFLGIVSIFIFNIILSALFGSSKRGILANTLLILLLSITNHLVFKFHGTPFTFADIGNLSTAKNVIDTSMLLNFILQKKYIVFFIITLFIVVCVELFIKGKLDANVRKNYLFFSLPAFILISFIFMFGINRNIVGWSWQEAINKYGYLTAFAVQNITNFMPVSKSDSYDKNDIVEFINDNYEYFGDLVTKSPDIVLIINESFYDFEQITNVSGDLYYLKNFYNTPNSITGYTIASYPNGGTNVTEYEVLTSNSHNIINGTPFNILDLKKANSLVSFLKEKNYKTFAMHPAPATNYNRINGYHDMGFDDSYFEEEFDNLDYYGDRYFASDDSCYDNLIDFYKNISGDNPIFAYCLTIQNHSQYEKNEESLDIVHVKNDFKDKTDDLNEYLSFMYLSDEALKTLLEYFESLDRDIVVAMCGDHKPPIDVGSSYSGDEYELRVRSTPFIIWSNKEGLINDYLGDNKRISMIYFVPTILEAANMPLSGYYDFLIEMRNQIPILSKFGKYYTASGDIYSYEDETEYTDLINQYFNLEYFNITNPNEKKEFFVGG